MGSRAALTLKRAVDLAGASAGLVLLGPLMAATAVAIAVSMGRPVLFRHERPGLGGRPFTLLKFRTMTLEKNERGELLPDGARLTSVGRLVRGLSLDELPQLWNVVRGEMSLVGPRPLLMQYLSRYSKEQARRHEVRPGITGWAQINGRNALSWEEKFALDVYYVDHWSLLFDAKILALTAMRVLRRDGINRDGHATAPEFMGSSPEA